MQAMKAMKAMIVTILTRFLFCLVLILAERGEALVIYRLGGEDLPVPEAATEEGVDFVQLFWADVDDDLFGSSHQLETSRSLIPVRLDPSVNLTPSIRERGGRIQLNNSYGWQDQPDLDFLFDGDYDTAYQGVPGDQSGSQYLKGIWIDFAGLFPIRRVVLQPSPKFLNERFVKSYVIGTNDGDIRKRGTREYRHRWRGDKFFDFDVVYNVTENRTPVLDLELPDVPIAEMLVESPSGDWEIAPSSKSTGTAMLRGQITFRTSLTSVGAPVWATSPGPAAKIREPVSSSACARGMTRIPTLTGASPSAVRSVAASTTKATPWTVAVITVWRVVRREASHRTARIGDSGRRRWTSTQVAVTWWVASRVDSCRSRRIFLDKGLGRKLSGLSAIRGIDAAGSERGDGRSLPSRGAARADYVVYI